MCCRTAQTQLQRDQPTSSSPANCPDIGTLTQVGLKFGRGGFYTSFTVDSGGVIKKPRLKDLIEQIGGKTGGAKITG